VKEYVEEKQYVESEKPYWLFVDAERGTELSYNLFNYFPDAHYRKAIENAREDQKLVFDGGDLHKGNRRVKLYYWMNPETDAALTHTEVNGEEAIPFFDAVGAAEDYLEKRAETVDNNQYEKMSLYVARVEKLEDAKDVLTEQAGIEDFDQFRADGGREQAYFWYDPETNEMIQNQFESDTWAGLFDQEEEAVYFLENQELPPEESSRIELYEAELNLLGIGSEILD